MTVILQLDLVQNSPDFFTTFSLFSIHGLGSILDASVSPQMLLLLSNIFTGIYLFAVIVHSAIIFPNRTLPLLQFVYKHIPKNPNEDIIKYCEFWILLTSWCIYAIISFIIVPSLLVWNTYINDFMFWRISSINLDISYFPSDFLCLTMDTLKYGIIISTIYLFQISVAWSNYVLFQTKNQVEAPITLEDEKSLSSEKTHTTTSCNNGTVSNNSLGAGMTATHWVVYTTLCLMMYQFSNKRDILMIPVVVIGLPLLAYCISYFFLRELDSEQETNASTDNKEKYPIDVKV
ncbi:uncharacterized protein SAPINGB_P004112 [Magnusiomyces paraingens]|uniref:Uncharacterized protein n=1 Tax=Magnusiomyces paraingens TaxID=2606893 RepID=A0A5E8BTT1_9ASCO|nr:uncharacterized protein SAPINGB_P004112 [Saprochaete ingens]VVT54511.1 unnamed protein product [Saprochaete ingens]